MKMIITALFMFLISISSTSQAISDQILLETSLTELAQNALDNMYGKGNFIVRARVAMTAAKYEVNYTKESSPQSNNSKANKDQKQPVYILPGVPALKNIAPDAFNKLPYDSVTQMIKPKIKKIHIYMIVNKGLPKRKAREAQRIITELLSLNDKRDSIKVTYKRFEVNDNAGTQQITLIPGDEKLVSYQNIFYFVIILLLMGGLIAYIIFQRKKGLPDQESSSMAGGVSVSPNIEVSNDNEGGESQSLIVNDSTMNFYFQFINKENINNFIFLLKKETINPEYLAIILSYLPSSLSSKILSELDMDIKRAVISHLIKEKLGNKELIEQLEGKLKNAMECFIGGEKKVELLLSETNSHEKQQLLNTLEQHDPGLYQKVRKMVILFEDLQWVSDAEIQLITSEINLEVLAIALMSADQSLYDRCYTSLSESAQAMLTQYLELKKEEVSDDDIQKAQDRILKRIKVLIGQGKITLNQQFEEGG